MWRKLADRVAKYLIKGIVLQTSISTIIWKKIVILFMEFPTTVYDDQLGNICHSLLIGKLLFLCRMRTASSSLAKANGSQQKSNKGLVLVYFSHRLEIVLQYSSTLDRKENNTCSLADNKQGPRRTIGFRRISIAVVRIVVA